MPAADYSSYHQPPATVGDGTKLDNFIDAVQATVNALDKNNIASNAGILPTQLANVVKTTTSTFAGGPPGSPADGDVWIATAVDANGARWAFQYNAGSASASKWEFIGGGDAVTSATGTPTVNVTASVTAAQFTAVRAGDYTCDLAVAFGATIGNGTFIQLIGGWAISSGSQSGSIGPRLDTNGNANGSANFWASGIARVTGISAAGTVTPTVYINPGTVLSYTVLMRTRPIRVA